MATIKQVGPGRKTTGTIDGITYVVRNGKTFVRSNPIMPAKAYTTPAALKRQAIFKMIQMHLKYHLRTIRQTFTPKGNGNATNRYYAVNGKALRAALDTLADLMVAGELVTIDDVEEAICAYAAANPKAITIGRLAGYGEVYLEGEWPSTITLRAAAGASTIVVIVAENGQTTTFNPDGSVVVVESGSSGSSSSSSGSGSGSSSGSGTGTGSGGSDPSTGSGQATVAAPTISGTTPFEETTSVTITGPAGSQIRYTLDGSNPSASSTLYSEAITLTDTTTVKAIAIVSGQSSSVTTKVFTKGTGGGETETE